MEFTAQKTESPDQMVEAVEGVSEWFRKLGGTDCPGQDFGGIDAIALDATWIA
jgi:hypothetical protein